jgi:hypothetical protein
MPGKRILEEESSAAREEVQVELRLALVKEVLYHLRHTPSPHLVLWDRKKGGEKMLGGWCHLVASLILKSK